MYPREHDGLRVAAQHGANHGHGPRAIAYVGEVVCENMAVARDGWAQDVRAIIVVGLMEGDGLALAALLLCMGFAGCCVSLGKRALDRGDDPLCSCG